MAFLFLACPGFKFGMYHHYEEHGRPQKIQVLMFTLPDEAVLRISPLFSPAGSGPHHDPKACMFTNSPDGHFILDLHPQYLKSLRRV
ncbi:MAG: hypothetical protein R2865_05620 [Deinococcales bacterium]